MWRPRLVISNSKVITKSLYKSKLCFSSYPSRNNRKIAFRIITVSGAALVGTVIYAKYEPRFKHFLGKHIPYIDRIYKLFYENSENQSESKEIYVNERKQNGMKNEETFNSIEEKFLVGRSSDKHISNIPDQSFEKASTNQTRNGFSEDEKHTHEIKIITTEPEVIASDLKTPEFKEDITSIEDALIKTILETKKFLGETLIAYKLASNAVKFYTGKLNEAIEISDYNTDEAAWEEVNDARTEKEKLLNFARKKVAEMKVIFENLQSDAKRLSELGVHSSLAMHGENIASKCLLEFYEAEKEMRSAGKEEAKEVVEYEKILTVIKELFEKGLEKILPNEIQDYKIRVEDDLNLLIAHAYNKIEQLQEKINRLQKTEEKSMNEVKKVPDEHVSDIAKQKYLLELNKVVENHLKSMKIDFEDQSHKLLVRQVAAHADYLQESLKLQELELKRDLSFELEEKLLNQKEDFVSEMCENVSRLKLLTGYVKRMNECNKSTEKVKALWLTCQDMYHKIMFENLSPLLIDVDKIRVLIDKDNDFVPLVMDSIPDIALNRGVFTVESLKQRFAKVKKVCQKVALIDEKNDSLYLYFLSILQSFLVVDTSLTRKHFEGEDDDEISNLDTFDILQRITYFLETGNLEKSLHYANQLKGEPRVVAQDWINEFSHLLGTQIVLKTLIAYASAISIQIYY